MDLATITHTYLNRFKARYSGSTTQDQWSVLNAILGCRTEQYGELQLSCSACPWRSAQHRSCGHRSCHRCQNPTTTQWLERQQRKLLPVEYFMMTFTLPHELRSLARRYQKIVYGLLFECAVTTLKDFGLNEQGLAAELAMTAVLHTHSRKLDYHPHVHIIVPGGGINTRRNEWRKIKGRYLFNAFKLATVFRGKLLSALHNTNLAIPETPKKWVVDCQHVGHGLPALQYLSRYLYRGVIANDNILSDDGEFVTFQYTQSTTKQTKTRRLRGEDFIALLLQHTLPKGFRRARDYGFLHGNAKRLLQRVQWLLQSAIPAFNVRERPPFLCQQCKAPMLIIGFKAPNPRPG